MESHPVSKPQVSNSAVASLIFGLLGCIPILPGAAAVILGILGIKRTNDPMFTGRGMAIAGLILGVLSLGAWTVGLVYVGTGIAKFAGDVNKERAVAEQYARELSAGQIDAALALSVEGIDREMLAAASQQMKQWGLFQKLEAGSVSFNERNGRLIRLTLGEKPPSPTRPRPTA